MKYRIIGALVALIGLPLGLIVAPFVWGSRRRKVNNPVQVIRPTLRIMKGGRK